MTTDIGLNEYEIFDSSYRAGLNTKIENHFMNQEIGMETISAFRFAMRRKMAEIMPFYNQLYKSTLVTFEPLITVDLATLSETEGSTAGNAVSVATGESSTAGTSTETTETDNTSGSKASAVASSFPQSRLGGNADYATSGQDNVSESVASSTGSGSGSTQQDETNTTNQNESSTVNQDGKMQSTTKGFQGNQASLLMDFRATFLNVDMQVISELEELFMSMWNTSDSYTGGSSYAFGYYGW